MPVETYDTLVFELNSLHLDKNMSWRQIALEPKYRGIPHSTLMDIANGKEPKAKKIRLQLGLPIYENIEVCPGCGVVHVKKCPKNHIQKPKPIQDMSTKELLWCLENRMEF